MNFRLKNLFCAALLVSSAGLLCAGETGPAAASRVSAMAYEFGPGVENLSYRDTYARYQWGLKNDGDIEYSEVINRFSAVNPILAAAIDLSNAMQLELPDENSGPDMYRVSTIKAVSGADINILPAWKWYEDKKDGARDVLVAVIDTGVDINHTELVSGIFENKNEIAGDGIDNDGNGYVDDVHGYNFFSDTADVFSGTEDDHGTHAAGTIIASRDNGGIAGICDQNHVKVLPLKVLGFEEGIGAVEDVIAAIKYADAMGADICNLSFGSYDCYPELMETMSQSDMLFVVAAGNGNSMGRGTDNDQKPLFPASYDLDNIISVANLMFDGSLSASSNFGAVSVDIAAPGTYIVSTAANNRYGYMSGTSMAAPMVTGAAAFIYSARTDLTLSQVRTAILSTAHQSASLSGKVASGGWLDIYAALKYQP